MNWMMKAWRSKRRWQFNVLFTQQAGGSVACGWTRRSHGSLAPALKKKNSPSALKTASEADQFLQWGGDAARRRPATSAKKDINPFWSHQHRLSCVFPAFWPYKSYSGSWNLDLPQGSKSILFLSANTLTYFSWYMELKKKGSTVLCE